MKEKDVIPYKNDENDINKSVDLLSKKRRRRRKLKRLLAFAFILAILVIAHNYKGELLAFYNEMRSTQESDSNDSLDTQGENISSDISSDIDSSISDTSTKGDELIEDVVPQGSHLIIENHYSYGGITNDAMIDINSVNEEFNIPSISEIYKKYGNEAPCILIIHSSALEAYSNGEYYTENDDFYSSHDNVSDIGRSICQILNENHINAIHIDDIYANGSIYSSTKEYEATLNDTLKKYPSIAYVFDISRDVQVNDDLTMNKPIFEFNETKMAQIKLTIGTSDSENKTFWHKNLIFSNMLASANPDLIYDLTLSSFELSQNISPISVKIDIGSFSNSINEATLAGNELASRLCTLLKQG